MEQIIQKLDQILTELRRASDAKSSLASTREIMSLHEAAEYLRQSEYTLRKWVRLQQVPFSKINGETKFKRSKLDRWIDRNEVGVRE
ncbi:MAG: helix-turn-helix domain-containing protein [bacterium]|nr:helix-turn-helix domain-containing protein [bacterium]